MRLRTLIVLFACALSSTLARGDATYQYTGQDFAVADPPYTTSDHVTAAFTFSSVLGDNLNAVVVPYTAFTVADGVHSFAGGPTVAVTLTVSTGATGDITGWSLYAYPPDYSYLIAAEHDPSGTGDYGGAPGAYGNNNLQGSWLLIGGPAATPEPSAFALLGTGLLAVAGIRRRFWRSVVA